MEEIFLWTMYMYTYSVCYRGFNFTLCVELEKIGKVWNYAHVHVKCSKLFSKRINYTFLDNVFAASSKEDLSSSFFKLEVFSWWWLSLKINK